MQVRVDLEQLKLHNSRIKELQSRLDDPNLESDYDQNLDAKKYFINKRNEIIKQLFTELTGQATSYIADPFDDGELQEVIVQTHTSYDYDYWDEISDTASENDPLMSSNESSQPSSSSTNISKEAVFFDLFYFDVLDELFSSLEAVPLTDMDFDDVNNHYLINTELQTLKETYQAINTFEQSLATIDSQLKDVNFQSLYNTIKSNMILLDSVKPMCESEIARYNEFQDIYFELCEYAQNYQNLTQEDITQKFNELTAKQDQIIIKAQSSEEFREHMQDSLTNVVSDNDTAFQEMYDSCYEYLIELQNKPQDNQQKINIMGRVMTHLASIANNQASAAENTKAILETIYKSRKVLFADQSSAVNFFVKAVARFVVFCLENKLISNNMLSAINSYYTSSLFKSLKESDSPKNTDGPSLDDQERFNDGNIM